MNFDSESDSVGEIEVNVQSDDEESVKGGNDRK